MNDSTIKPRQTNGRRGSLRMVALRPVDCRFARAQARGWNDVRDGKGFRDDYDGWSKKVQWAYERGRQQATLAKMAAGSLTVWNREENLWGPLGRAVSFPKAYAIINECASLARRTKKKSKQRRVS